MTNKFCGCKLLKKIYLLNFNIEKVKDMNGIFDFCTSLKNIDLSLFNTENVTNMNSRLVIAIIWKMSIYLLLKLIKLLIWHAGLMKALH